MGDVAAGEEDGMITPEERADRIIRYYPVAGRALLRDRIIREINDALADAKAEEIQWQPITTAPKRGDLLLSDGATVSQGGWLSDTDQGAEYEGQLGQACWWSVAGIEKPTHWMSLPEPPVRTQ